jgi:hypothetical protein
MASLQNGCDETTAGREGRGEGEGGVGGGESDLLWWAERLSVTETRFSVFRAAGEEGNNKFVLCVRQTSDFTRHAPHATRHKSHVTRHVSHPQKCRRRSRRAYVAPAPRIKRMHMKGESNASLRLHLCAVDIHCCGHLHVRQERIRGSVHVATSWLQYVFVFCVWRRGRRL